MADEDLSISRTKFNRVYSAEELALFARYVERRAVCRPAACTHGERCWVALGPPGLRGGGSLPRCIGCGGRPLDHPDNAADAGPRSRAGER